MINYKDSDLKKYKKLKLQSVNIEEQNNSVLSEDISDNVSSNKSIAVNICVGDLEDDEIGYVLDIETSNTALQTPNSCKHTSKENV